MNGHQHILELRRSGQKPACVWVSDFPDCTPDGFTVCVTGDTPELEDFRFLVGLKVIVEGQDHQRVDRIAKACAKFAARVIASVIQPINEMRWEVTSVTDTEGVLSWQQ